MIATSGVMLASLLAWPGPGAPPIDLFEAGAGGYATYRIPGLVATAKGTLLAYAEARAEAAGDWGASVVVLRRGADGGASWSAPEVVAEAPAGAVKNPVASAKGLGGRGGATAHNPVMIASPGGEVHLLFCVEYNRAFHARSDDDGRTFSPPREITGAFDAFRPEYDWKVLAVGPGHAIETSRGRLVVPVWLSTGAEGHAHRPSAVATIVSDDGGASWRRGAIVAAHPDPANPSEAAVAERSDGCILLNVRHESKTRLRGVAVGPDGERGWEPLRFDPELPEAVCMASLCRLDPPGVAGPDRILYSGPHNPGRRERKNLTARLSEDGGRHWPLSAVIDPGPSGYSDLAVLPGGRIFCLYERLDPPDAAGKGSLAARSLRLARLAPDDFRRAP